MLASMVYKFFAKKSAGSGVNIHANNKIRQNQRPLDLATHGLVNELHKPIIKKLKKEQFIQGFKDNIWGADLSEMQLISKCNEGFRFSLFVVDFFSKYAWVVPLKTKTELQLLMLFRKF